jgi:hypothetical protein
VYQHFISPQRKLTGYEAVIASPLENIAILEVHPEYYESLQAQYDDQFYRQEVLGEYLNIYAGACYPAFDQQRCAEKRTAFEPNLNGLAWTLDFNIDPMASLICQTKGRRRLDVLNEITLSVGNAERMCEAFVTTAQPYLHAWRAARGGFPLPVTLYGDACGHARSLVGKTTYAVIEQYFRDGARDFKLEMNPNISNPPVIDRVGAVNAMLYNARGEVEVLYRPELQRSHHRPVRGLLVQGQSARDRQEARPQADALVGRFGVFDLPRLQAGCLQAAGESGERVPVLCGVRY